MMRDTACLSDHDDLLTVVNLIGLICDAPHRLGVKHITQGMPHTVVVESSTTRQPALGSTSRDLGLHHERLHAYDTGSNAAQSLHITPAIQRSLHVMPIVFSV